MNFELEIDITKISDEQLVFGWLSIANNADGTQVIDKQGDIIEPADLEKAAYDFTLYARTAGEMHERMGVGRLVESMVFTQEKKAAMGIPDGTIPDGWWVGYKIDDPEVWGKVKSGQYSAFSIGGKASREEVVSVA